MIIHQDLKQGTEEWIQLRAGKLTASRLKDVIKISNITLVPKKTLNNHCLQFVAEKYAEKHTDHYTSYHMAKGQEKECDARQHYNDYCTTNNIIAKEIGFIESDCHRYGMSPDGIVGENGFIEIKCLKQVKHLSAYLSDGKTLLYDEKYLCQILMGFIINPKFEWCDLISYNDDYPITTKEESQIKKFYSFRITRESQKENITKLQSCIKEILELISLIEDEIKNKNTTNKISSEFII